MNGFDIVIVIAVILFARLGVRLVVKYLQMRKENGKNNNHSSEE